MNFPILNSPKPNTDFSCLNNRLALFHKYREHKDYWSRYWENSYYLSSLISAGNQGDLGEFNHIVKRHVKIDQLVLEAGCGPGHLVAGLTANGFRARGVDYEPSVVRYANIHLPDEDITQGDVLSLSMLDNSIGCYLSIGVVEHFIDGPLPALYEARRVLQPDGVALISVPYLNPARERLLEKLEEKPFLEGYHFHQYYYSISEFTELLLQAGFNVIDFYPYAVQAFLTREHPGFKFIWNSTFMPYRIQKRILSFLERSPSAIRKRYGHMIMFVCKPV